MALFVVLFALTIWAGFAPPVSVSAESDAGFRIERYDVKMDVKSNRVIKVEENLTVKFSMRSSGIIRDFPLESGVRYQHLSAKRDGQNVYTHAQTEDSFLSLYIGREGQYLSTSKDYVYTISYTMTVPKLNKGYLPLDVVGYGWGVPIYDFTAEINLPAAPLGKEVYTQYGKKEDKHGVQIRQEGNTLYLSADSLGTDGVTLDLSFENGVLTTSLDPAIFWAVGLGAALMLLALVLKLLCCRQPMIVKSVGLEAPKGMDPLLMGVKIDNKVDSEDMGALVFWLAAKGYLKIDLTENDEDPNLIRLVQHLPPETPSYIVTFFEGLFRRGDMVRVSSLTNSFYMTADAVKKSVNAAKGKLYKTRGTVIFCVLWALAVLLLGGFALVYGMLQVALSYHFGMLIPLCIFSFLPPAVGSTIALNHSFKWKKARCILISTVGLLIGLTIGLIALITPSAAFSPVAGLIFTECSAVIGTLAALCGTRTEEYSEELGLILGFKDFIQYTEQDRIKVMLEENPELYYSILPYAQVLGVSDAWADKFKGLNMPAPAYVNYHGSVALDLLIWNTTFRNLNRSFARTFVSRPSSKGGAHGHGGGFGGGFGGGGFGGGGGRRF